MDLLVNVNQCIEYNANNQWWEGNREGNREGNHLLRTTVAPPGVASGDENSDST